MDEAHGPAQSKTSGVETSPCDERTALTLPPSWSIPVTSTPSRIRAPSRRAAAA